MSHWQRIPDRRSTRTTADEHRHAAGLAALARVLTEQGGHDAIIALKARGAIDAPLADLAMDLVRPENGTTARLRMSRHSALMIFFQLMNSFEERWLDPFPLLQDRYDEDDYGRIQAHLQTMADMAGALSNDAFHATRPPKDPAAVSEPPAAAPPARPPRVVKPSSVARLEALRGEFSDDPEGIGFILSLLHVLDKSPHAILDALEHNLETPDAAAAASPTPAPATPASPLH